MGTKATDYLHLTEDKHQQALYRLAAVGQYLYDTMAGDEDSDRPEPMPAMAMECVRKAQRQIDLAIKHGQRTRRRCLGGDLKLVEWPYDEPSPSRPASRERQADES
jgi:hypothetical protein